MIVENVDEYLELFKVFETLKQHGVNVQSILGSRNTIIRIKDRCEHNGKILQIESECIWKETSLLVSHKGQDNEGRRILDVTQVL